MARGGAVVCWIVLIGVFAWVTVEAQSREEEDRAFALGVTTMLLVSPLTWEHYLPLLLLPLAVLWIDLPSAGVTPRHLFFVALVVILWASTDQVSDPFLPGSYLKNVATPIHTITLLSLKCYTLLGLFAFGVLTACTRPTSALVPSHPGRSMFSTESLAGSALLSGPLHAPPVSPATDDPFPGHLAGPDGGWPQSILHRPGGALGTSSSAGRSLPANSLARTSSAVHSPANRGSPSNGWGSVSWRCSTGSAGSTPILLATATLLAVLYTWLGYRLLRARGCTRCWPSSSWRWPSWVAPITFTRVPTSSTS